MKKTKFYKRWHEHCGSEAPKDEPHYESGLVSLNIGKIKSKKDFKKFIKKIR